MRKKLKKLALNRETVLKLDADLLARAAGGTYTYATAQYTNCTTCSVPSYCGYKCREEPSSPFLTECPGCQSL